MRAHLNRLFESFQFWSSLGSDVLLGLLFLSELLMKGLLLDMK